MWALLLPSAWQSARGLVGRDASRCRRKGWRFALAWSGVRGSVALAAVLSLPQTIDGGDPFPGRDLLLLMTLIVIVATLVAQGLTLRPLLRALDLTDPEALHREDAVAREHGGAGGARAAERGGRAARAGRGEPRVARARVRVPQPPVRRPRAKTAATTTSRSSKRRMAETDSELLEAARDAVMELAARGDMRAEVAQEVLRDLDLDNARITDPEKTGPP